jgi:hypothetical protein
VGREIDSEDEILAFVRAAINSVCALELLILLRRDRKRAWPLDGIVRELRSSELAVTQALDHLTKYGLVVEVPEFGYSYRQASTQLDVLCEQLEFEYAHKPVTVIRAILDAPNEKLRIFADAFRLSGRRE